MILGAVAEHLKFTQKESRSVCRSGNIFQALGFFPLKYGFGLNFIKINACNKKFVFFLSGQLYYIYHFDF